MNKFIAAEQACEQGDKEMHIVWPFDPFEKNSVLKRRGQQLLSRICTPKDRVSAVYVAAELEPHLSFQEDIPESQLYSDYPQKLMKKQLAALGFKRTNARVISAKNVPLTGAARALSTYATKDKADLIVMSTHSRRGIARFVLGSFAETFVHVAQSSLLLFNEKTKIPRGSVKSILYAHDFTRKGEAGFKQAIVYARIWGARLDVIHIPKPAFSFEFDEQDPSIKTYRKKVRAQVVDTEETLAQENAIGSVVLVSEWKPLSSTITEVAEELKSDVICVSAQMGRLGALLGGSVTRQLIREAPVPILVLKT